VSAIRPGFSIGRQKLRRQLKPSSYHNSEAGGAGVDTKSEKNLKILKKSSKTLLTGQKMGPAARYQLRDILGNHQMWLYLAFENCRSERIKQGIESGAAKEQGLPARSFAV
jgi:hypothetical protein